MPEALTEHVRVMDDGWLVFADLATNDTTTAERLESFLEWARTRSAMRPLVPRA